MLGTNTGRVHRLGGVASAGMAALLMVACAASTSLPPQAAEPGMIDDVRVESHGDVTTVTLMGLEEPIFTAFGQRNPERVVVDVASATSDPQIGAMPVQDGLVNEVMLAPYQTAGGEPMTRVEVALDMAADYEVLPTSEGLMIRVMPIADDASEMGAVELDPWAMQSEASDSAMPVSSEPATQLMDVQVSQVGDGSLVHLVADGTVTTAESFTLENPERLVIDLPGMKSSVDSDKVEAGTAQALRVRIGQHADMVRVVIDGGDADDPFATRRVMPVASGLLVALGADEDLEMALAEAAGGAPMAAAADMDESMEMDAPVAEMDEPMDVMDEVVAEMGESMDAVDEVVAEMGEPMDAMDEVVAEMDEPMEMTDAAAPVEDTPMPAAMDDVADSVEMAEVPAADIEPMAAASEEPAVIFGVEFDSQVGHDRIVILSERPIDYKVFEPSPDTMVLSIQNAKIDPEAVVRIAPEAGGPVSLVTAFEQPDTDGTEVRVVMRRADGLKPEIVRRGSLVVIDFPRDGSVASPPPVLATSPAPSEAQPATPAAQPTTLAQADSSEAQPAAAVLAAPEAPSSSASAQPAPAAIGSEPAIEVLREGGLMDGKEYAGRRISLDFKDIDMADVLRLIAEVSDLNVIAGDEVSGRVTIRLVDVPWDQALDVILLTKGLGFMRVGNVLRIAPADVLRQEEEMRLQERRALEQLEDLIVKLQPVNYAAVEDMKGMVGRLLTSRGTVDSDKRTNTLIIKDIPSVIDEATALIKAIDTQTPQVLIEAKIVEANLDFSREFGVAWGMGAQPLEDAFDSGSLARRDLGGKAFRLNTTDSSLGNNANFLNPLTAGPTSLFNLAGFLLDEKINLELQLQAAEVNGDGKVISSPRVVTLDNSKATIEQGVSIPFQTFENGDAQLEFVDAVLKLDVTPHVTADRSIIMDINVSRNAPDDSVFTLTGSPAIAKNQVDTETLVKDGQTLVIGGIYVVDKADRQSRVPYLHSIPIIGTLFRSDEHSDSRKELLIFVTPRVVMDGLQASAR